MRELSEFEQRTMKLGAERLDRLDRIIRRLTAYRDVFVKSNQDCESEDERAAIVASLGELLERHFRDFA